MTKKIDLSKYSVFGSYKGFEAEYRLHNANIDCVVHELKNKEDIIEKLKQDASIFKIELTVKTEYSTEKLEYFIADKIEKLDKKPTILAHKTEIKQAGWSCKTFNHQNIDGTKPVYQYTRKPDTHTLDSYDVVLNRELKQIYPRKTGKIPAKLIKFLAQNTK